MFPICFISFKSLIYELCYFWEEKIVGSRARGYSVYGFIFSSILQVLSSYANEGFPFLLRAFNIPKYLEDLTGLTKLMEDTKLLEVMSSQIFPYHCATVHILARIRDMSTARIRTCVNLEASQDPLRRYKCFKWKNVLQ